MKYTSKLASAVILMAAILGCPAPKGSPVMTPSKAQRIFRLPFERVWTATLAVLTEDLNLPLDEVVPDTGMVSTKWVVLNAKPGDFQQANRPVHGYEKSPMLIEYRIVALVKKSPEGTMVRVRRYSHEYQGKWIPLPTDLVFERQFLDMIAARLGVAGVK